MAERDSRRSLIARMGAFAVLAKHDPRDLTLAARTAADARFLTQVDPAGLLPEAERMRRAEAARRLWYTRLAYASVTARKKKKKKKKKKTARGNQESAVADVGADDSDIPAHE